ncbi:hypothetical protein FoTM2_003510 [Fusarium oxysporum f. sp. vasinfectum]|nr:hypothetical protein FoTM2_003510 [Fusarium oxysporum f. sp. vasinfectum]
MPVQPHIGATALLSVMDREILASNSVAHLHTIRDPHLQEGPDQTAYRPHLRAMVAKPHTRGHLAPAPWSKEVFEPCAAKEETL